jgi:hypothetical protein
MTTPSFRIPEPPAEVDLGEFPAVIEPPLRQLPEPGPAPGTATYFESERRELTPGAELLARATPALLAEEGVRGFTGGRELTFLGASRRVDAKPGEPSPVTVVAYDYAANRAYAVQLEPDEDLRVTEVTELPGQPPLSDEEIERAAEIALADPWVARRVTDGFLPMVLLTSDVEPGDEHWGRRRAYVGFGPPDERLPRLRVIVDLGAGEVVATSGTNGGGGDE